MGLSSKSEEVVGQRERRTFDMLDVHVTFSIVSTSQTRLELSAPGLRNASLRIASERASYSKPCTLKKSLKA